MNVKIRLPRVKLIEVQIETSLTSEDLRNPYHVRQLVQQGMKAFINGSSAVTVYETWQTDCNDFYAKVITAHASEILLDDELPDVDEQL